MIPRWLQALLVFSVGVLTGAGLAFFYG